jgi:hypothetical protein
MRTPKGRPISAAVIHITRATPQLEQRRVRRQLEQKIVASCPIMLTATNAPPRPRVVAAERHAVEAADDHGARVAIAAAVPSRRSVSWVAVRRAVAQLPATGAREALLVYPGAELGVHRRREDLPACEGCAAHW